MVFILYIQLFVNGEIPYEGNFLKERGLCYFLFLLLSLFNSWFLTVVIPYSLTFLNICFLSLPLDFGIGICFYFSWVSSFLQR